MDLQDAIQERKSVRNFSKKKVDWRDIIECIDSVRYAPMAGNIFTPKFIVVLDKKKIGQIADACQQEFVGQVDYVVVVCSNPKLPTNEYGKQNSEVYTRQQAGAAIQNFLLSLTERGISTCWVGYFVESQIKSILTIPEPIQVEAVFPIGMESQAAGQKSTRRRKIDINSFLFFDKYNKKKMNTPAKFGV